MRENPVRLLFAVLLIAPVLLLGACSDSTGPGGGGVGGTYTLRSINNQSLPYLFPEEPGDPDRYRITDGAITLNPQGFTASVDLVIEANYSGGGFEQDPQIAWDEEGTYSVSGNTVTLAFEDEFGDRETLDATVNGNTLTLRIDDWVMGQDYTLVFRQ